MGPRAQGEEGSSVKLQAQYESIGLPHKLPFKLLHSLRFEIVGVGGDKQSFCGCAALGTRPSISTDPRNVFSRKVKAKDVLKVKKSYVVSRKTFEFGPLLVWGCRRGRRRPRASAAAAAGRSSPRRRTPRTRSCCTSPTTAPSR